MAAERERALANAPHCRPERATPALDRGASRVLALQRTVGNRATARLLARDDATLTGPLPQLTLDPRFMPPASSFGLAPPDFSFGYKRQRLPPVGDLHQRPWSLSDLGLHQGGSSRPDVAANLFDWRKIVSTLPDPPSTVTVPAEPRSAPTGPSEKPDDPQALTGVQWAWTAGKAKPDRTVQIQFQKGTLVIQGSVDIDTGAVQWMAGAQPQISTPDYKILGAIVSAQAFVQVLAGVTVNGPAGGDFTVQASAGVQLTIKWGPITAQLQAGPQVAWTPKDGWSSAFTLAPGAGPSDPFSGAPGLPPMKGWVGLTWYF